MPEQSRSGGRTDGRELGHSFEASNSPSFAGDLGPSFEETNQGPQDHPRKKWYWIGGILLLVLVIFLVHHYSGDTTGTKPADGSAAAGGGGKGGGRRGAGGPAAITIAPSTTGNMPVYVQALGTVTPTYTVTLYSQVTGRVIAVHYTEGELVRKGQPLVEIDPQPAEAALQQAEGNLKHDEGVLEEAQMDLKRYQDAAAKNAIARQQLEDQEKAVIQDEGTVESDKGTVQADKVQLAYCHIVAPIAGRVGLRLVDPGNTVFSGSSSTLVVITALQPITVVFNVSEDDLPSVQAQLKGKNVLKVDAFDRANDKQLESGKLTSLDNQIDTTTGTVKFRAGFANKALDLFPNQFVNARLLLKTLQNVTLVPNAAVQHNGTAAFVYVVKDDGKGGDTVAVQDITTYTSDDNNTAVTGLDAGVQLATSGFDRLEPGAKVHPQQAAGGKGGKGGKNAAAGAGTTSGTDTPGGPGVVSPTTSTNAQPGSGNGNGSSSNGSGASSK
jgi:multidrug efflux system membrane fusion protein